MPKNKETILHWKADTKALFEEIISCGGSMWIMQQPLKILHSIMLEAAHHAMEIQDEKMIAIMARLGLYEACNPKHKDHKKILSLINKFY